MKNNLKLFLPVLALLFSAISVCSCGSDAEEVASDSDDNGYQYSQECSSFSMQAYSITDVGQFIRRRLYTKETLVINDTITKSETQVEAKGKIVFTDPTWGEMTAYVKFADAKATVIESARATFLLKDNRNPDNSVEVPATVTGDIASLVITAEVPGMGNIVMNVYVGEATRAKLSCVVATPGGNVPMDDVEVVLGFGCNKDYELTATVHAFDINVPNMGRSIHMDDMVMSPCEWTNQGDVYTVANYTSEGTVRKFAGSFDTSSSAGEVNGNIVFRPGSMPFDIIGEFSTIKN